MIRIIGTIFGISGYDIHTRRLANALQELTQDVKLDVPLPNQWQRFVTDAEYNMLTKESFVENDSIIAITQPHYWSTILSEKPKKFYGYVVWEGERIPKYWIEHLLDPRVDGILVPSQHVKDAIIKITDIDFKVQMRNKIHIVPHGVDLSLFSPREKDTENFVFCCNKGWRGGMNDRGGVQFLLKAFNEEFSKDEKVELKLKINPSYLTPNWNIGQELINIGVIPKSNMMFNLDALDYKQIKDFYKGDVFITTSMAEAFNIPCIEAMACGLPVISTNFGGQVDFVNESNGWLIGGDLIDVTWDVQHEGNKWLKPNVEEIRKILRQTFENSKTEEGNKLLKQKSENALKTSQEYTWRNSAKKIKEIIN